MANTRQPRPLDTALAELRALGLTEGTVRLLRDTFTRSDKVLTDKGEIQGVAPVLGRTEGIGTTVGNIDSGGVVLAAGADFSRAYANKNTDNIADGTGSPLTGGKRGFQALDTNNRLASSLHNTAVNVTNIPSSTSTLSNNGIATAVSVAANSQQFPSGPIAYNSGSFDPGVFGSSFAFGNDPTFAGGAVAYQFSATASPTAAGEGLVFFGKITTANGAAHTGGGDSGGDTPGGQGGALR